jgi:hypothetical protein
VLIATGKRPVSRTRFVSICGRKNCVKANHIENVNTMSSGVQFRDADVLDHYQTCLSLGMPKSDALKSTTRAYRTTEAAVFERVQAF